MPDKKNPELSAENLVRLMEGMEESQAVTVIKPELIEPIIRRKIEEITQDIEKLQKCTLTFANSPTGMDINESKEVGIELVVTGEGLRRFQSKLFIQGNLKPGGGNDFYAYDYPYDAPSATKKYFRWRPSKNKYSVVSRDQFLSSPCTIIADSEKTTRHVGQEEELVEKKYGSSNQDPGCGSLSSAGEVLIKFSKIEVTQNHKLAPQKCSGECSKVNVSSFLTGSEITSDQVSAKAKEVLQLKLEERKKLEDIYLRFINAVVDQIGD